MGEGSIGFAAVHGGERKAWKGQRSGAVGDAGVAREDHIDEGRQGSRACWVPQPGRRRSGHSARQRGDMAATISHTIS